MISSFTIGWPVCYCKNQFVEGYLKKVDFFFTIMEKCYFQKHEFNCLRLLESQRTNCDRYSYYCQVSDATKENKILVERLNNYRKRRMGFCCLKTMI